MCIGVGGGGLYVTGKEREEDISGYLYGKKTDRQSVFITHEYM